MLVIGIIFAGIGLVLIFKRIGEGAQASVKVLGSEFSAGSSGIAVFLVGAAMIILPFWVAKDKKKTVDPGPISFEVSGNIYQLPGEKPLKNVEVLPAFQKPKILSDDNGGFSFSSVAASDLGDTFRLSFFYKDSFINTAKFATANLKNRLNVFLNLTGPTVSTTGIISNLANSIVLKKVATINRMADTCQLFLNIKKELALSKSIYEDYRVSPTLEKASQIHDIDKRLSTLLQENNYLIPGYLKLSTDSLLQHFIIWASAFENADKKGLNAGSRFRLTYSGLNFPSTSAEKVNGYSGKCLARVVEPGLLNQ